MNKDNFIFLPNTHLIIFLNCLSILCIISQTVSLPLIFCFSESSKELSLVNIVIDIYIIIMCLLTMLTGFYDKTGTIITDKKEIIVNYMRNWLVFDFITSFPFSLLYLLLEKTNEDQLFYYKSHTALNILELLRIFRIIKIPYLISSHKKPIILFKLEESISPDKLYNITAFLKLFLFYAFAGHIFTCIWLRLCFEEYKTNELCFISNLYSQSIDTNLDIYTSTFYFMIVSAFTTGFGDMTPITNNEKLLFIVIILLLYSCHTYLLTEASTLTQRNLKNNLEKRKMINSVNTHYTNKQADYYIIKNIYKYMTYKIDQNEDNNITLDEVLSSLNLKLRSEVIKELNKNTILLYNPFQAYESIFNEAQGLLKEELFNPSEEIISQGQSFPSRMYFIQKGSLLCYNKETTVILNFIKEKNVVGEIGFFTGKPRTCSVISTTFTSTFYLLKSHFLNYLKHKGQIGQNLINNLFTSQSNNDIDIKAISFEKLNIRCYFCQSFGHLIGDCSEFIHKGNRYYFTTLSSFKYDFINKNLKNAVCLNSFIENNKDYL